MVRSTSSLDANQHKHTLRSEEFRILKKAIQSGFPNCKGTYPDCPEKPSKDNSTCRACPVLEEILEQE